MAKGELIAIPASVYWSGLGVTRDRMQGGWWDMLIGTSQGISLSEIEELLGVWGCPERSGSDHIYFTHAGVSFFNEPSSPPLWCCTHQTSPLQVLFPYILHMWNGLAHHEIVNSWACLMWTQGNPQSQSHVFFIQHYLFTEIVKDFQTNGLYLVTNLSFQKA